VPSNLSAEPTQLDQPQAPPNRPAAAQASFEILHSHIEIEPRVLLNPIQAAANAQQPHYRPGVQGSVARLSNGLVVSRTEVRGVYHYAVYGPNPDGVALAGETRDWPEFFRASLEKWEIGPGTHLVGPRKPTDVERFVGEYPTVAAKLGIRPALIPKAIFPVGPARIRKNAGGAGDLYDLLDRHASGDFGLVGAHADLPLTAEQLWAIGIQPVEIQNRHAIRTGRGCVQSRFPFSVDSPRPGDPPRAYACVVYTLLSDNPRTLIDVESA
jgi:hypothetical protein